MCEQTGLCMSFVCVKIWLHEHAQGQQAHVQMRPMHVCAWWGACVCTGSARCVLF